MEGEEKEAEATTTDSSSDHSRANQPGTLRNSGVGEGGGGREQEIRGHTRIKGSRARP